MRYMLLGRRVYTHGNVLQNVHGWEAAGRLHVDALDIIRPSGDYSLDVLHTALKHELGVGRFS